MALFKRLGCTVLIITFSIGASGCNDADQTQAQSVDGDWVQNPTVTTPPPDPAPTPVPTPTPVPPYTQIYTGPAEVNKYVVKFVSDAVLQGKDVLPDTQSPVLQIQIGSLSAYGSSTIGLCETGTNLRRVTLSTSYWNSASETQRELLMHHELGHCVLYRPHRNDLTTAGAVASIMYPVIMSSSTYTSNYDYYQTELFTKTSSLQGGVDRNAENTHICL